MVVVWVFMGLCLEFLLLLLFARVLYCVRLNHFPCLILSRYLTKLNRNEPTGSHSLC